ncbi:energy coupling factor transporter S component ThiW [Bacillus sp. H-16]|uniref:energy coupling factor transporter S component ThiW n=1 Tax=Alteribacter salitolerans TaxID=2912333 RepID=UPI0019660AE5|nr:energy coupling factor transporter S component ThiW [Alteribacter salitolerans]MBM7096208.1 energy coupling factor transporter S component ThiW [Alteribacter salitolerans]
MTHTKKLTIMAMFTAIGIVGAAFIWFPALIARAYPIQHMVNVLAAVLLGPIPAVLIAFMIGLLRNLLGLGTVLAFPGGMIGALLAGLFYRWSNKTWAAAVGEVIGTAVIGAIVAVPIVTLFFGDPVAIFAFVPGFLISSSIGAFLALLILKRWRPDWGPAGER